VPDDGAFCAAGDGRLRVGRAFRPGRIERGVPVGQAGPVAAAGRQRRGVVHTGE